MDWESLLLDFAYVATDICFLRLFYRLYREKAKCLKSLQEATVLEINNDLPKTLHAAGGVIPYAVITGNVKALAKPLRSHKFSYLSGVIYESITKENILKWSPLFNIWKSSEGEIQRNTIFIPFGLCGGGIFKKLVVEVIDPMAAQELVLYELNNFKLHKESFADMLLGYFRGERTISILEVENMLLEDTYLRAIGKIVIENDKLKILPPGKGLTYFLTPLSLESLIEKMKVLSIFYKGLTLIMGSVTLLLLAYLSKKGFPELKRRIDHAVQLRRYEKERQLRRKAEALRKSQLQDNGPKCVVCFENPVEILIFKCGHTCLCRNCSRQINTLCPVCRGKITRLVPAFLP